MLVELLVENYAVVERLRVRFHPGLNLLTGETGSGKSIVVGALGLLLGGRASADLVRVGASRARVAGIFELPADPALQAILEEAGVETEDGELLIEREVQTSGKSRAFAGCRPVTVALLRRLAPFLCDIHGQHDQQRLFESASQLEMLDAFAGVGDLVKEVGALYAEWRRTGDELARLASSEQERMRLIDLWKFQRREIEEVAPRPGEDESLEQERRILQNVTRLEESTNAAHAALYEAEDAALTRLQQAIRSLDEACSYDQSLQPIRDSLEPAAITIEEAARELQHYIGRLESDPRRLDEIEDRLAAIDRLKRKYGSTVEEILAYLEDVKQKLEETETSEEKRRRLEERRGELARQYEEAARRLTRRREAAARKLERFVQQELRSLAMEKAVFRIKLERASWSPAGADRVEFLVSANPGQPPGPLDKVPSGGELSRIALALKTCVAGAVGRRKGSGAPRTLVFDEVDSGVGGSAAETVGRRLKQIAAADQVLCVTHLPQIAGFADHHYLVRKTQSAGGTVAAIEELDRKARIREIGRMLSGRELTPEALRHAEKLIEMAAG